MTGGGWEQIRARDEILQVMYWLEGEALSRTVDAETIGRFLPLAAVAIDESLADLAASGLLSAVSSGGRLAYALTEAGRREGGRRFADEFADMVKPGHGECADPDCDCHDGSPADCRHKTEG